jgi:hypothetical protein
MLRTLWLIRGKTDSFYGCQTVKRFKTRLERAFDVPGYVDTRNLGRACEILPSKWPELGGRTPAGRGHGTTILPNTSTADNAAVSKSRAMPAIDCYSLIIVSITASI